MLIKLVTDKRASMAGRKTNRIPYTDNRRLSQPRELVATHHFDRWIPSETIRLFHDNAQLLLLRGRELLADVELILFLIDALEAHELATLGKVSVRINLEELLLVHHSTEPWRPGNEAALAEALALFVTAEDTLTCFEQGVTAPIAFLFAAELASVVSRPEPGVPENQLWPHFLSRESEDRCWGPLRR